LGPVPVMGTCLEVGGPRGCCNLDEGSAEHYTNFYFEDGSAMRVDCGTAPCGLVETGSDTGLIRCGGQGTDGIHAPRCGDYAAANAAECSALGQGQSGQLYACGETGLQCQLGKDYCRLSYPDACTKLPDECTGAVASCACFPGLPGYPKGGPGGWYCMDTAPGVFVVGIWI
jgi:hypothetical protein